MTEPSTPRVVSESRGGAVAFARVTHSDDGGGQPAPALLWRFAPAVRSISSAMLGGGIRQAAWVINAHVRSDYGRLDPDAHLRQIALDHGLDPAAGVGLLTAARVERVASASDAGVRCDATVGVSYPTWAAAPVDEPLPAHRWVPGTINLVCQLPVPLTDAGLVGAVLTATEAKTQALVEAGVPGTGTASDAIVVCCPVAEAARPGGAEAARPGGARPAAEAARPGGAEAARPTPEPFAGPRSTWGARLARAVHDAVSAGLESYARHA